MKRILILSVAIGSGHLKTADALAQTYRERFGGEAYPVDFMRQALPGFSAVVEQSYYLTTHYTPFVYQWLYQLEDRKHSALRSMESRLGLSRYAELVREFKPDAIISTHSFPAVVASRLFPRHPIPNAVVVTDYTSHHIWVNPNTHLYFVAHPGMVGQLQAQGVPAAKIRVTGIPVRPAFTEPYDRSRLQRRFGLEPGLMTLMVMSGGNAIGPMTEAVTALAEWKDRIQLIAAAGHNQGMYHELTSVFRNLGLKGMVLPFVDNIQEYMAVSDLLVSKAGGLTVAESLVMGLPMLVIRPTPGQEDGNTQFLENCGAGIYLRGIPDLKRVVAELLRQPGQIGRMRQNALNAARPDASESILAEMEQLIRSAR
jgi:processive 1,2-diacylglycerol beta-glucosyltransferase